MLRTLWIALFALSVPAVDLVGQSPIEMRYVLGQRLRRVELAWIATPADDPRREPAREAVGRAVAAFFSMNLSAVGQELDEAWVELNRGKDSFDELRDGLAALSVVPSKRVYGPGEAAQLEWVEAGEVEFPGSELTLVQRGGPIDWRGASFLDRLPDPEPIPFGEISAPVDRRFQLGMRVGAEGPTIWLPATLASSLGEEPESRIDAVEQLLKDRGDEPRSLESESVRGLVRVLRNTLRGAAYETDVPAARLLGELEAHGEALRAGSRYPTDSAAGEHWLRVPTGNRAVSVRLAIPERESGDEAPRPLIVALHGMGGSEHLFFDGHGDGLLLRLAAEHGCYVVAPRALPAGSAGALVDALDERLSIDRERVYAIGHSMGAGTALAIASRQPELFKKVVMIGGGGRPGRSAGLRNVPFLILPGEFDFARAGAERLHRSLQQAEVPSELRVVPGVEHMLVVVEALPAAIEWLFDSQESGR